MAIKTLLRVIFTGIILAVLLLFALSLSQPNTNKTYTGAKLVQESLAFKGNPNIKLVAA